MESLEWALAIRIFESEFWSVLEFLFIFFLMSCLFVKGMIKKLIGLSYRFNGWM